MVTPLKVEKKRTEQAASKRKTNTTDAVSSFPARFHLIKDPKSGTWKTSLSNPVVGQSGTPITSHVTKFNRSISVPLNTCSKLLDTHTEQQREKSENNPQRRNRFDGSDETAFENRKRRGSSSSKVHGGGKHKKKRRLYDSESYDDEEDVKAWKQPGTKRMRRLTSETGSETDNFDGMKDDLDEEEGRKTRLCRRKAVSYEEVDLFEDSDESINIADVEKKNADTDDWTPGGENDVEGGSVSDDDDDDDDETGSVFSQDQKRPFHRHENKGERGQRLQLNRSMSMPAAVLKRQRSMSTSSGQIIEENEDVADIEEEEEDVTDIESTTANLSDTDGNNNIVQSETVPSSDIQTEEESDLDIDIKVNETKTSRRFPIIPKSICATLPLSDVDRSALKLADTGDKVVVTDVTSGDLTITFREFDCLQSFSTTNAMPPVSRKEPKAMAVTAPYDPALDNPDAVLLNTKQPADTQCAVDAATADDKLTSDNVQEVKSGLMDSSETNPNPISEEKACPRVTSNSDLENSKTESASPSRNHASEETSDEADTRVTTQGTSALDVPETRNIFDILQPSSETKSDSDNEDSPEAKMNLLSEEKSVGILGRSIFGNSKEQTTLPFADKNKLPNEDIKTETQDVSFSGFSPLLHEQLQAMQSSVGKTEAEPKNITDASGGFPVGNTTAMRSRRLLIGNATETSRRLPIGNTSETNRRLPVGNITSETRTRLPIGNTTETSSEMSIDNPTETCSRLPFGNAIETRNRLPIGNTSETSRRLPIDNPTRNRLPIGNTTESIGLPYANTSNTTATSIGLPYANTSNTTATSRRLPLGKTIRLIRTSSGLPISEKKNKSLDAPTTTTVHQPSSTTTTCTDVVVKSTLDIPLPVYVPRRSASPSTWHWSDIFQVKNKRGQYHHH